MNCSNVLALRNLSEQVKKAFCHQKVFCPYTAWINCSSDPKIFENSQPSALNFKSFFQSVEQFFLTVGQNNFGNKIPLYLFLWSTIHKSNPQLSCITDRLVCYSCYETKKVQSISIVLTTWLITFVAADRFNSSNSSIAAEGKKYNLRKRLSSRIQISFSLNEMLSL